MMSSPVVAFHLGLTHSSVAVYNNGTIQVIHNERGNKITPSYIAFTDTEVLIGEAARENCMLDPENTIYDVSRLIGRTFNDVSLRAEIKDLTYTVINEGGRPKIKVRRQGIEITYTPEEICAKLIRKLKEMAEAYSKEPLNDAFITIPEYFDESQTKGTVRAAVLADVNVIGIIKDPIAAVMSYGLEHVKGNCIVLDIGANISRVTVLTVNDGVVAIKNSSAERVGGLDYDIHLAVHLVSKFKRLHQKDLTTDKRALRRLQMACAQVRRKFLTSRVALMNLEQLFDDIKFSTAITLPFFEKLTQKLSERIVELINNAVTKSDIATSDINYVVFVGESIDIIDVIFELENIFKSQIKKSIDPATAVVYGAALQGDIERRNKNEANIIKTEKFSNIPNTSNTTSNRKPESSNRDNEIGTYRLSYNVTIQTVDENEAEKCFQIAQRAEAAGDHKKADRFYLKYAKNHAIKYNELKIVECLKNKAEAEKFLITALQAQVYGNLEKSNHFLLRYAKLQTRPASTPKVLNEAKETTNKNQTSKNSSTSTNGRRYTDEHLEAIRRVNRNSQDIYAILELEKNTERKILQKQMKLMKRLLHPDKNAAPGAQEAYLTFIAASERITKGET